MPAAKKWWRVELKLPEEKVFTLYVRYSRRPTERIIRSHGWISYISESFEVVDVWEELQEPNVG